MPISTLSNDFTVSLVDYETRCDLILNIQKRREIIDYRAGVSYRNPLLSFINNNPLTVENNLHIVDKSGDILIDNTSLRVNNYNMIESVASITVNSDDILITDVTVTETSTQEAIPLFYKHRIDSNHFDPSIGDTLISIRLLNKDLNEIITSEYYLDSTNGFYFNNLKNEYNDITRIFQVYYLQYTVRSITGLIKVYTVLLSNESAFTQATIEDIDELGFLIPDRKVYLIEELVDGDFLITLPSISTYYYKVLSLNKIYPLKPIANTTVNPWYVRINNGLFYSSISGTTYKYRIAEILDQTFTPSAPIMLSQREVCVVLNKNLIKTAYGIYQDDSLSLFVDIYIYNEDNDLIYVLTTNSDKHGQQASQDEINFSCLDNSSYGIRSCDKQNGFIEIKGIDLKETYTILCTYYYECKDLLMTSINFNPLQNQDIIDKTVIFFLIPETLLASSTKTIYYLIVNEYGKVIYSDWDNFDNDTQLLGGNYLFYGSAPAWFTTEYGTGVTNFIETYTVRGSGVYMTIGEVSLKHNIAPEELDLIDIRQGGGGLAGDSDLRSNSRAQSCWDLGYWDGRPYPYAGCYLVEIPVTIMSGAGGDFRSDEIREIVERHTALGIYPLIRAYGIDPRITYMCPNDGSVTINWTHGSNDTYYNIYISRSSSGPFELVNLTPIIEDTTLNTYTVSGLDNDAIYYLFVVGGKYVNSSWQGYSEQFIGPGNQIAQTAYSFEMLKFIPGCPRPTNLFSQEFIVTV